MPECSRDDIPRARSGAQSNRIPGNGYEETKYGMFLMGEGRRDTTVNVERGCGARVTLRCDPEPRQVTQTSIKLYLSHTRRGKIAHVTFVCEVKSQCA